MPTADDLRRALHTLRAATAADLALFGHALAAEYELADVLGPEPERPVAVAQAALAGHHYVTADHDPERAVAALQAALARAADDLNLNPDVLTGAQITVTHGDPGTVYRDGHRYP